MVSNAFFLLSCLSVSLGLAASTAETILERIDLNRGADWVRLGNSEGEKVHVFGISFRVDPDKRNALEEFFWAVSDPRHASYGKYLTQEELAQKFLRPAEESVDLVEKWLLSHGITGLQYSPNGDYLKASATLETLGDMLGVSFGRYYNAKLEIEVNRADTVYHVPSEVAKVVAIVDNILAMPGPKLPSIRKKGDEGVSEGDWPAYCPGADVCAGFLTPNVTALQYNSFPLTQNFKVADGNGYAVMEFQHQKYDLADIELFAEACNQQLTDPAIIDVNGNADGGGGIECMLDIEYIIGNGVGIPLFDYWYLQYSLLDMTTQINGQGKGAPTVYSVSYGNDEVQQVSEDYMYQCNTQFMAAGTLGYTIMFASGDNGVWGRTGYGDGVFYPDFPASSPYILAVGGSDFRPSSSIGDQEVCCPGSGGGFSNTFAMPDYQTSAVQAYITAASAAGNLPDQAYWNASGRAYPDIAANFGLSSPYCIAVRGFFTGAAGTSAACPVAANGITILNNIQMNAGKPPLGFANPWLYQTLAAHPDAFKDVVEGQNNGLPPRGQGFHAMPGWDPCTGVGNPDFQTMAQYLP